MPANKLSDLLPLAEGQHPEHAYDVFGLPPGESDPKRIETAISQTVAKLTASKSDADPQVWTAAAKLASEAQTTLTDSHKKSQLDAKLQQARSSAAVDPLASVLPSGDPLADVLPDADPGEADHPTTQSPEEPAVEPEMPSGSISVQVQDDRPARRSSGSYRRRKSPWPALIFTVVTFGMVVIAGTLAYFVFFGPGEVAITKSDRGINIRAGATQPSSSVSPPASKGSSAPAKTKGDSIIGNVPVDSEDTKGRPSGLLSGIDRKDVFANRPELPSVAGSADEEPMIDAAMREEAEPTDEPTTDEPTTDEQPADEPPMAVATTATTAENEQAAARLEQVSQLIREANWEQMKSSAAAALEMPMSPKQKQLAAGLYQLADLATYYRGGIQQAIQELQVGNDFAVTDDFRVLVVEANSERLVVRFDAKNRTFPLDELPFVLAHKLATFKMPSSPASEAAKAAYQAVVQRATAGHRAQSIDWLLAIDQPVEGADPKRMAEAIRQLYLE